MPGVSPVRGLHGGDHLRNPPPPCVGRGAREGMSCGSGMSSSAGISKGIGTQNTCMLCADKLTSLVLAAYSAMVPERLCCILTCGEESICTSRRRLVLSLAHRRAPRQTPSMRSMSQHARPLLWVTWRVCRPGKAQVRVLGLQCWCRCRLWRPMHATRCACVVVVVAASSPATGTVGQVGRRT